VNAFFFGAFFLCMDDLARLKTPSGVFAAVLAIFSGAHFMHVYSGQTAGLATMTWGPLIFLAIDGIFETRKLIWALLGMFAVAMQVFAGHPNMFLYRNCSRTLFTLQACMRPKAGLGFNGGVGLSLCRRNSALGVQLLPRYRPMAKQSVAFHSPTSLRPPPRCHRKI